MARKVRCPQCGAKNASDVRRCRVCTAIINTSAPEPGKVPPKDHAAPVDVFDASALDRTMAPKKSFLSGSGLSERLAAAAPGGEGPASDGVATGDDSWSRGSAGDDPFRELAPLVAPPPPVEPIGYRPGTMASELFGEPPGLDDVPGDAIVIDAVPRHGFEPPPLELEPDEHFDPNDLVIERGPLRPEES